MYLSLSVHTLILATYIPVSFLFEDGYLVFCLALVSKRTNNVLKLNVGGRD